MEQGIVDYRDGIVLPTLIFPDSESDVTACVQMKYNREQGSDAVPLALGYYLLLLKIFVGLLIVSCFALYFELLQFFSSQ